jgi:hypothetical protein
MLRAGVQVLGYAALMAGTWFWLGIPESSVLSLLGSAVLAIALIAGLAWLLSQTFEAPFRSMLLWVVAAGLLVGVAVWLTGYSDRVGAWAAGQLSFARKKPAQPAALAAVYVRTLYSLTAVVLFALLAWVAARRPAMLRGWKYWALAVGLVVVGFYLPSKLVVWVPQFDSFTAQTASMTVRFGAAYAIALAALLGFAAGVRRLRSAT